MSNPTPRPASPVHPTRQQLDELETLMQRMLALPVNQLDDDRDTAAVLPAMGPTPEWESAPDLPALLAAETPRMEEDREPEIQQGAEQAPLEPVAVFERSGPWPTEEIEKQEARNEELQDPKKEPPGPVFLSERTVPLLRTPIVVRPAESEPNGAMAATNDRKRARAALAERPRRPMRHRPGLGLRLLWWSNRTFDRHVGRLGGTGRWLRGRYGRAVLGLTGLLLLVAALVFGALDWIGWTW